VSSRTAMKTFTFLEFVWMLIAVGLLVGTMWLGMLNAAPPETRPEWATPSTLPGENYDSEHRVWQLDEGCGGR